MKKANWLQLAKKKKSENLEKFTSDKFKKKDDLFQLPNISADNKFEGPVSLSASKLQ